MFTCVLSSLKEFFKYHIDNVEEKQKIFWVDEHLKYEPTGWVNKFCSYVCHTQKVIALEAHRWWWTAHWSSGVDLWKQVPPSLCNSYRLEASPGTFTVLWPSVCSASCLLVATVVKHSNKAVLLPRSLRGDGTEFILSLMKVDCVAHRSKEKSVWVPKDLAVPFTGFGHPCPKPPQHLYVCWK